MGVAQPWPAWKQGAMPIMHESARSASSSTMVARLAAELEEQALHRRRALLHDALADRSGSGERDQVDLGRHGELLADQVVGGGDDVDHARRGCRYVPPPGARCGWR